MKSRHSVNGYCYYYYYYYNYYYYSGKKDSHGDLIFPKVRHLLATCWEGPAISWEPNCPYFVDWSQAGKWLEVTATMVPLAQTSAHPLDAHPLDNLQKPLEDLITQLRQWRLRLGTEDRVVMKRSRSAVPLALTV